MDYLSNRALRAFSEQTNFKNIHQYSFLPKMWFFRREYFLCGEKAVLSSKFGM